MITFPENAKIQPGKRVKFGIDPTFPRLHLGHLVPLRVCQKMIPNNDVTIVLGTFTAQLGDPSGRDTTRPILSKDEVETNAHAIFKQVGKLLKGPVNFFFNDDIHGVMRLPDFLKIASGFTLSHLMSRNAFANRIENGQPIAMHELLVPICQGWDSVYLKSEIEIGGQDQLFNFQIARQLQEIQGLPPQVCLMLPIIRGTDGRKMSKSLNNCIFLDEVPDEIFGKVMSISDEVMDEWFPLLTDLHKVEHPLESKKKLAFDIVRQLHGDDAAVSAKEGFEKRIQNKEIPEDIPEVEVASLIDTIVRLEKLSKSAARRLLEGGGVKINDEKVFEDQQLQNGQVVKIGKRRFVKVK